MQKTAIGLSTLRARIKNVLKSQKAMSTTGVNSSAESIRTIDANKKSSSTFSFRLSWPVQWLKSLQGRQFALATKMFTILMLAIVLQVQAESKSKFITLSGKSLKMNELFVLIKAQTGYNIFYNKKDVDLTKSISLQVKNMPLEDFLKLALKDLSLTYSIEENTIVLSAAEKKSFTINNPEETSNKIIGRVTDTTGNPLAGASIAVKGKGGSFTDADGRFSVDATAGTRLYISFVGYESRTYMITDQTAEINLQLIPVVSQMEEVAVVNTGYQTIPKERAAGSYSVVTAKDMSGKLQPNIMDRMEGMVAGVNGYKGLQIRGTSTINGNKNPLIVVDEVPFEGPLTVINPAEVVSMTVLKDATAASIYGARAANGVIVITTKHGVKGPARITYNGLAKFTPLPSREYSNLMSSKELVDFQEEMFNNASGNYSALDPRKAMNDVYALLYERKAGNITDAELEQKLDVYRNRDRYDQVLNELVNKVQVLHQHNLSVTGGSDFYKYNLSANYQGNNDFDKSRGINQRYGYNLKNTFNVAKWFKVDVGLLGNTTQSDYDNGFSGRANLNGGRASYFMLRDENGDPAQWYSSKSQFEIDRLNALGLMDETYRPLDEIGKSHYWMNSKYSNINIGTNFKLIDGVSLDLRYQSERINTYAKTYYHKDALSVKSQINDATVIDPASGIVTNYIPIGGQVDETRSDMNSHTLRAQLNYRGSFNKKHQINAIAGAEERKIVNTGTNIYKYGYDDDNLNYKPIDELFLNSYIYNTEALFNQFKLTRAEDGFSQTDDRFLSFYANGSYSYDRKLTATASIRMDQSNLFGTDPKYQYKPLWSAGLLYVLAENKFNWLDRLAVRATYGINGNVAKLGGPYLIAKDESTTNFFTNEFQSYVVSPPNSGLRWEKTQVTNFAVDFDLFKRRLTGSVEVYNKNTNDLLGNLNSDPTIGWNSITVNYGSMVNKGIDVTLTSFNVDTRDFKWNSTINFNYNKNRLTRLENSSNELYNYLQGPQNRVGKPMAALYSVRYAGLDATGKPTAYTADGKVVNTTQALTIDDLVYEGTATPPYAASLLNTVGYKGFELFFMFTYYGGNVMRDVKSPYLTLYPELNYNTNIDRSALDHWKQPGDEANPDIAPAYSQGATSVITNLWDAADKHIQKGDYIKLRDVTLSYDFSNSLKSNAIFKQMRVSLQVQNAWRWAANKQNLDPEVWSGTTLSPARGTLPPTTYTLGLTANF